MSSIKIDTVEFRKSKDFIQSKLTLKMSGKKATCILANTFRRIALDDIPTYAFAYVNIEQNTSILNNDMMNLRLKQLPIYDMECPVIFLHPKYWQDVNYSDLNREKHESEKSIEAIINSTNTTNNVLNVTTDDIKYYVDNEEIQYPARNKKEPILLLQLRPSETFKCQMKGCLGVAECDNMWSAANIAYYEEKDGDILFSIESANQISEYEIMRKACKLIKLKLHGIENEIKNRLAIKEIEHTQIIFFDLINEDHTMGNLINDELQNHKDIVFAGISKPDHLIKQIRFKICSDKSVKSPINAFFDVLSDLEKLITNIEKQL